MLPPLSFSSVPSDATPSPEAEEVSVSTVAATAVATGHLMLKLEGYSRLKARHGENGSYIESPASKIGGHTWTIRCYLNGYRKEDAGFVSVFLRLRSDPGTAAGILAEREFALVPHLAAQPPAAAHGGQAASKPASTALSDGLRSPTTTRIYGGKGGGSSWGIPRMISVENLERSVFLKDDCFAVRCAVTVVEERTVKDKVVQPHDLARLGMLCKCDDDLCKRHHASRPAAPAEPQTFLERFAKFCYSICRGSSSVK